MKKQQSAMAWEEPGGNKQNKDPWKRRTQEGPPDLDLLFKNFFKKLKGNTGSGGGGHFRGGATSHAFPYLFGGIFVLLYVIAGFYRVNPPEQAVVTRFGHYQRLETPGLHWIPPLIEAKKIINVERIETTTHGGGMLTEDENIVAVEVDVQYRIEDPIAYLFQNKDPIQSLKEATESALRQVVGHLTLDDILTTENSEKEVSVLLQKQDLIGEQVQRIINPYQTGIRVTTVAMKQPQVPPDVKDAFDDVIKAREDRETVKNTAKSYSNKVVPEAEGEAESMIREARGYEEAVILEAIGQTARFKLILPEYQKAPRVTQTRLYLDTVEEVLSNTSKVLVDLSAGSNSLVYLPLDRLIQGKSFSSELPTLNSAEKNEAVEQAISNIQNDSKRNSRITNKRTTRRR